MHNRHLNSLIKDSETKLEVCTIVIFFFFQAEDGIRDWSVTGVQTCALPIYHLGQLSPDVTHNLLTQIAQYELEGSVFLSLTGEIGRASCRERV